MPSRPSFAAPAAPSAGAALALALVAASAVAAAHVAPLHAATLQDAQSILETAQQKQTERYADVDNYTIVKSIEVTGGMEVTQHFEKMMVEGQPTFRLVPQGEYESEVMTQAGFPPGGPEASEGMAMGLDLLGPALASGGGDMPPMPGVQAMTSAMSSYMRATADAQRNMNDGRADAEAEVADMADFARRATLKGREATLAHPGGATREAYVLVADGLDMKQSADGGTFTLHSASLWIDTEHYVPLRLLMEGEVESKGEKTPLTIEKLDLDYRQTGPLYEPYHEVARLSGIMSAMSEKDRKEMEKARQELVKVRKEMESMPASQRNMVMKMMGPQIEKFEKMVAGETYETSFTVVSIAVNEGPPTPFGPGELIVGGAYGAAYPGALTVASEGGPGGTAELAITARLPDRAEASIGLTGAGPFPGVGGSIGIIDATGSVRHFNGGGASIDGGSGTISVTERTDTHIAGTFEAALSGTDDNGNAVQFTASGSFDTGAPVGPYQAPRGSPFPADLFEQ